MTDHDSVKGPEARMPHPSGVECVQITEHMGYNLGIALTYIWRADLKSDNLEDLKEARWFLDREIARRETAAKPVAVTSDDGWTPNIEALLKIVHPDSLVKVRYRNGVEAPVARIMRALDWRLTGDGTDIVQWRYA